MSEVSRHRAFFIGAPVSDSVEVCELCRYLLRWRSEDQLVDFESQILAGPVHYDSCWTRDSCVASSEVCSLWCLQISGSNLNIRDGFTFVVQDYSDVSSYRDDRSCRKSSFSTFLFSVPVGNKVSFGGLFRLSIERREEWKSQPFSDVACRDLTKVQLAEDLWSPLWCLASLLPSALSSTRRTSVKEEPQRGLHPLPHGIRLDRYLPYGIAHFLAQTGPRSYSFSQMCNELWAFQTGSCDRPSWLTAGSPLSSVKDGCSLAAWWLFSFTYMLLLVLLYWIRGPLFFGVVVFDGWGGVVGRGGRCAVFDVCFAVELELLLLFFWFLLPYLILTVLLVVELYCFCCFWCCTTAVGFASRAISFRASLSCFGSSIIFS